MGLKMASSSRAVRVSFFRMELLSEIEIEAEASQIWEVLTNFEGYKDWNPAIPMAVGEAIQGSKLHVNIQWPDLKPNNYELEVLVAEPNRELRWLGHFLINGLLDGDHSFIIEPACAGCSNVIQKENFSGILVPIFAPWLRNNILNGFDLINQSLKKFTEQFDKND